MSRRRTIAIVTAGILLAATSYMESSSRYHLDTLRSERRYRLRILGVPIPWSQKEGEDRYSGLYQQITGKATDPQRWHQMPADFVCFLWGSQNFCYGSGIHVQQRRELLAAVCQKFLAGEPQAVAAAQITRIDALLPMPRPPKQDFDWLAVDTLRKELGLTSLADP